MPSHRQSIKRLQERLQTLVATDCELSLHLLAKDKMRCERERKRKREREKKT